MENKLGNILTNTVSVLASAKPTEKKQLIKSMKVNLHSAFSKSPQNIIPSLTKVINYLSLSQENSVVLQLDEAMKSNGYLGTSLYETVAKAYTDINSVIDALENVIEELKSDIREQKEFMKQQQLEQSNAGFDALPSPKPTKKRPRRR